LNFTEFVFLQFNRTTDVDRTDGYILNYPTITLFFLQSFLISITSRRIAFVFGCLLSFAFYFLSTICL